MSPTSTNICRLKVIIKHDKMKLLCKLKIKESGKMKKKISILLILILFLNVLMSIVSLGANQSIRARVISAETGISVAFLNNDLHTETATTIPNSGEWVTLENLKDEVGYDSVPLIKTTVSSKANTELNKTYKIELEYDEAIAPVDYYHYLDNEEQFRAKWKESQNSFGILESETLIMVVPYADVPYMTNYYANGFTSLDQFFEYYQKEKCN